MFSTTIQLSVIISFLFSNNFGLEYEQLHFSVRDGLYLLNSYSRRDEWIHMLQIVYNGIHKYIITSYLQSFGSLVLCLIFTGLCLM